MSQETDYGDIARRWRARLDAAGEPELAAFAERAIAALDTAARTMYAVSVEEHTPDMLFAALNEVYAALGYVPEPYSG